MSAKAVISKQRHKIKVLQKSVRRLKKRINTLSDLLKVLREKSYVTESSEDMIRVIRDVIVHFVCLIFPFSGLSPRWKNQRNF